MSIFTPLPILEIEQGPPKPDTCRACVGWGWGTKGFMATPEGPGTAWNGVLLVGEALGEQEAFSGKPFVGKAGLTLSQMLQRGGLNREHFVIDNCLRCRPPDNKLAHMPYEQSALRSCAPHLDGTLRDLRPRAVVPMGDVALRRLLGISSFPKGDSLTKRRGFVERLDRWGTWMVPTFHPSFLMRGNRHLTEVFLSDLRRAVTIARDGYQPHQGHYVSDPSPETARLWVEEVEARVRNGEDISLAVDIETPYKNEAEDEGSLDMDDPTYTILRVGFAFHGRGAISLAWTPVYIEPIKRLLALPCRKLTWNGRYDMPRLRAQGLVIGGEEWDLMWAWHILHSSLPKGLGFVASLLLPDVQRWKHLSSTEAGKYNALDAEITWRLEKEIISRLKVTDLWPSFYRHIVQLDKVLLPMGERGMAVDLAAREALAKDLTTAYDQQLKEAVAVVPREARRAKLFKTKPKEMTSDVIVEKHPAEVPVCPNCGLVRPKKAHFKAFKKKANPCANLTPERRTLEVETFVKLLPWVPSNVQMSSYLAFRKHQPVKAKGKDKVGITFNEEAIKVLMRRYEDDPLYPKISDLRELETLASRYSGWWMEEDGEVVGGVPVVNGYVYPTFLHNPSTLRLACQAPNMQNIPRPSKTNPWPGRVKGMFVAPPGHLLFEVDYSAVEAVLVGYFARSARYIRLAKMGVHDYLNAHILHQAGKIAKGDIPELSLSDADLKAALKVLKTTFPEEREAAKRIVHGCFTGDHEVLTRDGWVRLDAYDWHTPIAEWTAGQVVFRTPKDRYVAPHRGPMVRLAGRSLSALATLNHGFPVLTSQGQVKRYEASHLPKANSLPLTGVLPGTGDRWGLRRLRLLVALQADGSITPNGQVVWHLRRPRKIERLKQLLRGRKHSITKNADGSTSVYVPRESIDDVTCWLSPGKEFILSKLLTLSPRQREHFLNELVLWDGSVKGHRRTYITTNKHNADVVQAVAHTTGRQALLRSEERGGRQTLYTISFNRRKAAALESVQREVVEDFEGMIYCPVTESGYFLARHNGRVFVSGNSNYGMTPRRMWELYPKEFPTLKHAAHLQSIYYDVCPEVRTWQLESIEVADNGASLRNPFGYIHYFFHVKEWFKHDGKWQWKWGEDAKAVLAFQPQSTAAAIIKEAMLRIKEKGLDHYLRLQVHDSLVGSAPRESVHWVRKEIEQIMTEPVSFLPLSVVGGEGFLTIGVEAKVGERWSEMQEVK